MALTRQEWTPDTMSGVTFVEEYERGNYDGTVTCVEVKDRAGTRATKDPIVANASRLKHLGNNQFKNRDLLPAIIAAVNAADVRDGELVNAPPFFTDENDEIQLGVWKTEHPSSDSRARTAIAQTKASRT